jgi:hypothetical protein
LGRDVIPEFRERHEARRRAREAELAPHIERALSRRPSIDGREPEPIEAYPVLWEKEGLDQRQLGTKRALDAGPLWRLHVAGPGGGGQKP